MFETQQPDDADFKHSYKGHRNSETGRLNALSLWFRIIAILINLNHQVKGVNFYGSNSDFVISKNSWTIFIKKLNLKINRKF